MMESAERRPRSVFMKNTLVICQTPLARLFQESAEHSFNVSGGK